MVFIKKKFDVTILRPMQYGLLIIGTISSSSSVRLNRPPLKSSLYVQLLKDHESLACVQEESKTLSQNGRKGSSVGIHYTLANI